MGSGDSSIGDIFFPDNPSRRRRAEQLRDDINALITTFNDQKKLREDVVARIKVKLDALLKSRGFNTPDELENQVQDILNGPELQRYNELSAQLNKQDEIEGIVWQVISFVGAISGVLIGGAFVAGVVTGGAALATIAVVGEVLAVIGVVVMLFSVVAGAIERDVKFAGCNQPTFPKRAEVKQALEQMRVIANWVQAIEVWLNPETAKPEMMDALLSGSLDRDYKYWTIERAFDDLHRWDTDRGTWTNEDPDYPKLRAFVAAAMMTKTATIHGSEPVMADFSDADVHPDNVVIASDPDQVKATIAIISESTADKQLVFELTYSGHIDAKSCTAEDEEGNPWKLSVEKTDEKAPSLENTYFNLEDLVKKVVVHRGVRLEVLGTSTS